MHTLILDLCLTVQLMLAVALTCYAVLCGGAVRRLLLLEALALVFVGSLAVLALKRGERGYLDVALVLSLLGFAQTVGVAHLVAPGRRL